MSNPHLENLQTIRELMIDLRRKAAKKIVEREQWSNQKDIEDDLKSFVLIQQTFDAIDKAVEFEETLVHRKI